MLSVVLTATVVDLVEPFFCLQFAPALQSKVYTYGFMLSSWLPRLVMRVPPMASC